MKTTEYHRLQPGQQRSERSPAAVITPCSASRPARVGANAEEGRVSERHDASVTEDEIQRQCEQRQPHDVGHDQITRRKQRRHASQRQQPEHDLAPDAISPRALRNGIQTSGSAVIAAFQRDGAERPNRPLGRQIRITIIMRVDDERSHLGHVIFAGDIADPQQQRGEKTDR